MADSNMMQPIQTVEALEDRTFLSAPKPTKVASAYFDNRGQVYMLFTVGLDKSTLSRKTASLYTAGTDGQFGTLDDVRLYTKVGYTRGRLSLRSSSLGLNQAYRVRLNAGVIKDMNGNFLDGEFRGAESVSGNGHAGGNYDVVANTASKVKFRFTTSRGFINVGLYPSTPLTRANFIHYANEGAWDTTFFHRSEHKTQSGGLDVIQGGGFNVANGSVGSVHQESAINLEVGNSNTIGTIAMARTSSLNSATNQWFFNTKANTELDTTGGGYAAFGAVLDAGSQQVIEDINNLPIRDTGSDPFRELPVLDPAAGSTRAIAVPGDLVMVTRVAQLFDPVATPNVQGSLAVRTAGVTTTTTAPTTTSSTPSLSPSIVTAFSAKKIEEQQSLFDAA